MSLQKSSSEVNTIDEFSSVLKQISSEISKMNTIIMNINNIELKKNEILASECSE